MGRAAWGLQLLACGETSDVKELAMTLLFKKIGGLGLFLLGGLMAAHGGSSGRIWELVLGLLVAVIGAGLLVAKIMRRNSAPFATLTRSDSAGRPSARG
jgi:hypothetical protein